MNIKRVGVLLHKEFFYGARNYIIVFAVVAPVMISIIISLTFGVWLSDKPQLGIVDEGSSKLVLSFEVMDSIETQIYSSPSDLKRSVENGSADIGIIIPSNFDESIILGDSASSQIQAFIWGESLARNQIVIGASIANAVRELKGQEIPVEIIPVTLGEETSIPWNERLFPFIVLMTVFLGGLMLPSTSIVKEKEKKTIKALMATPASANDIFMAKGILGFILSFLMGIVILLMNRAFGSEPWLLVALMALGAVMATELGVLMGIYAKDFTTIFAVWKSAGILLFAPAIIYMFPKIPQWIGKIFPTYYLIQPIVELTQNSGGWPDIALNTFILIAINILLVFILFLALKKRQNSISAK